MKKINCAFPGFGIDAAKKSIKINQLLKQLILNVESGTKIVTVTSKTEKRMENSFSKQYLHLAITMDHDSGYISHNQESNSDSSIENVSDTTPKPNIPKSIYLSEDALLEKPEISTRKMVTRTSSMETVTSPGTGNNLNESGNTSISPDTVLSSSIISQRTTYSEFDDSNLSVEIPRLKQIYISDIGSIKNKDNSLNIIGTDSFDNEKVVAKNEENDFYEDNKTSLAFNDITNTQNNINDGEKKKKLTLIFSKDDKENFYSVKRKYPSISPPKSEIVEHSDISFNIQTETENDKVNILDNSECTDENSTNTDQSFNMSEQMLDQNDTINDVIKTEIEEISIFEHSVIVKEEKEELGESNDSEKQISIEDNGHADVETKIIDDDSLQKELILTNELDLEKIVLQQESNDSSAFSASQEESIVMKEEQSAVDVDCLGGILSSTATPKKKFVNSINPDLSPDLFENEDLIQEPVKEILPPTYIADEKYIDKKDRRLLKRAQNSLKGVLPPQSVTIVQLSVDEMLNRLETNKEYFWTNENKVSSTQVSADEDKMNNSGESSFVDDSKSLLLSGNKECVDASWPEILQQRYHGLHHNRSKVSEELEELYGKYGQRYVGAETQSTCTVFETNFISPMKRRQVKQRWAVKSPGRRLSHLAKRRITFSNSNLPAAGSSSSANSRARQILIDAKKLELLNRRKSPRKSPRKNFRRTPRKTPSKSPRVKSRTPSSSAKKKLAIRFRELTGEIENTVLTTSSAKSVIASKRALFQSPDRDKKNSFLQPSTSGMSAFESELKKPATKRALFLSPSKRSPLKNSPFKRSPFKRLDLGEVKKRKRTESEDAPPAKFARSMSMDIRPSESEVAAKFPRTKSELNISLNKPLSGSSGDLSAVHKKKLQWAVYEALRSQNITPAHAQFKIFASILARVTRRFLPNLTNNVPKECGTTEKMLRIARHHVYAVIKGKSVDEIINGHLKLRARMTKPQGYVSLEGINNEKKSTVTSGSFTQSQPNTRESLDRKKLELLGKPSQGAESRIDRIRKVINFGDDNR